MSIKSSIQSAWIGTFDLYEETTTVNETSFISEPTLSANETYSNIPCRLSHEKNTVVINTDGVPYVTQEIILITDSSIPIPAGSVLDVTQHGNTQRFKSSSNPKFFTYHQEITLENYYDVT